MSGADEKVKQQLVDAWRPPPVCTVRSHQMTSRPPPACAGRWTVSPGPGPGPPRGAGRACPGMTPQTRPGDTRYRHDDTTYTHATVLTCETQPHSSVSHAELK